MWVLQAPGQEELVIEQPGSCGLLEMLKRRQPLWCVQMHESWFQTGWSSGYPGWESCGFGAAFELMLKRLLQGVISSHRVVWLVGAR